MLKLFAFVTIALALLYSRDYLERRGISRDTVYRLGMRLILWGLVGARIAWVLTHPSEIHSIIDVFAVWEGGLTFSGGFIAAGLVTVLVFPITALGLLRPAKAASS